MARQPSVRPTLVLDLPEPQLITVLYEKLGELVIPQEYQREIIRPWVFELADVLAAGGKTPPVCVNQRPDGRWVIVDGQQRWWAYMQANLAMPVLLYRFPDKDTMGRTSLEQEKIAYQIWNNHILQSGDNIVNSWTGPTARIVHHWVGLKGSPYHGRTSLGRRGGMAYSAAILARVICATAGPVTGARGGIRRVLSRSDLYFGNGHAEGLRDRIDGIMRLIPLVFPPDDRLRLEPALAVADVARERWAKGITGKFPKPHEQTRLRAINWAMLAPGYNARHFPTLRKAVEDRWRTGA